MFEKRKARHLRGAHRGCMLHFLSEILASNNGQEKREGRERGQQLQITLAVKTVPFVK